VVSREVALLAVSTPGKVKQACVILDDDEVSSDEDEPLQKRLWRLYGTVGLSGSRPATATPGCDGHGGGSS
jgi:hypothetical protein